jgi:hypothetical protein
MLALRPYQKHMSTSTLIGRKAPLEQGVMGAAIIRDQEGDFKKLPQNGSNSSSDNDYGNGKVKGKINP